MKASKVKAKGYITASLALAILIACGTAAAHESIYKAVEEGDIYAGRPFVDPETGYLFVDPDGMRDLRWQSTDMTAVRVADNDYTSIPIVTWKGLGRVESRDNAQVLVGALFMFDYDDEKLNETTLVQDHSCPRQELRRTCSSSTDWDYSRRRHPGWSTPAWVVQLAHHERSVSFGVSTSA